MEPNQIKEEFKIRKKKQKLIAILHAPLMLFFAYQVLFEDTQNIIEGISNQVLIIISASLTILGMILTLFNWRCPNCNKYLGMKYNTDFCSRCNSQLK